MDSDSPNNLDPSDQNTQNGTGSVESLHQKAHDVFPNPFSGIKLVINKGLSQNFQVSHTLNLSSPDQSGYRFASTYVGHNKLSETEAFPVFLGEVQPNGQLQAQIIHQFGRSLRLRYLSQLQRGQILGQQISSEIRGRNWNAGLTLINPHFTRGQFMSAVDIMRRLSCRFYLGSMFFYQHSPQLPGGRDGVWSFAGKYVTDNWQFAASFRPLQLSMQSSFYMKINDNLQVGAEFESNFPQQTNISTLGYQYEIPKTNTTFKAQIDSNWNIAAIIEKKLTPFPFSFSLSGLGNHTTSKYEAGVGFIVG